MSRDIKVGVIGAGSSYTPELIEGFNDHWEDLSLKQLALMDIDERRLEIVGNLARRMIQASGRPIDLVTTPDRRACIEGADFVINQIRVGGMSARILDEKIPPQFGVIGQETTGPGGFAKALRTIPVVLGIARDIEKLAPKAFLLNFTNPAGLITEAIQRNSAVKVIGLCNLPINTAMGLSHELAVARNRLYLDWVGLNHLNWLRGVTLDGKDIWKTVFEAELQDARQRDDSDWDFSAPVLGTLGMIPCGYLNYYYHHDRILAKQKKAKQTRGEEVQEIEKQLLKMYEDPELKEKPKLLEKRGGAYYSTVAVSLVSAIVNDKQEIHIVNTVNQGAIPELPVDVIVEVPAMIDRYGAHALPTQPMPMQICGLVQAVKAYEVLTATAGVEGSQRLALQALWAHPLVGSFDVAVGLVDALLDAHRVYLPQFFGGG